MEPYATASDPSPLNGNRPTVNGNNSFFTEYRTQILYSIGFVIFVVFVAVSTRGKYSWYDHGKVGIKKKSKKDKKKAANKMWVYYISWSHTPQQRNQVLSMEIDQRSEGVSVDLFRNTNRKSFGVQSS